MVPQGVNDMDNVHRDYLLKRFNEERDDTWKTLANEVNLAAENVHVVRSLTRINNRLISSFTEIEYQIRRAFDDAAKAQGGDA
jgi:hypothetical protein